jgi:L-aspartate semialdehyde sulfurtransferase ferredoxin
VSSAHLHLSFPADLISEPVLHGLSTRFELVSTIRRANLEEDRGGWLIVQVEGDEQVITAAVVWLSEQGVDVDRIAG